MIKWILSDLDGTLLDNDSNLPNDFAETLELMKKHNIMFSPASGRQYKAMLKQFKNYSKDMIFISENGTFVCQNGIELFSYTLPREVVELTIREVDKLPNISLVLSGKKHGYIVSKDPAFHRDLEIYYTTYEILDDFSQLNDDVIKIAICDSHNRDAKNTIYNILKEKITDGGEVILSGQAWVDVVPKGSSKGLAIRKLQEKLNIKPEECMAFGDYLNDYEMLLSVGESYAMENAISEIKDIAKHIAPPNYESGVTKTIKEFIQKEYE